MTVNIEIYEVTGPVEAPVVTAVNNVNFKRSASHDIEYFYSPLRRPVDNHADMTYSFEKWIYFTLTSTVQVKNLEIIIDAPNYASATYDGAKEDATNSQLFYKFSNSYVQPTGLADHSMSFLGSRTRLFPFTSSSSPAAATAHTVTLAPNVLYYTNYLVLQTRAKWVSDIEDAKNGKSYGIKFKFDSF